MTEARTRTLAAIRKALGRDALPDTVVAALDLRLGTPRANVVPARGQVAGHDRIDAFIAEAERVDATTVRLSGRADVPAAVMSYLRAANLPAAVRIGADPLLASLPWSAEPLLQTATGAATDADVVSVTAAFAGIAETGTLMLLSGAESPTTLNFLPPVHMVVLPAEHIVGCYEEAWVRLRATLGPGRMPRAVNWITGPSRTADIEQTLLLGAHGPKRLHILIIDERSVNAA